MTRVSKLLGATALIAAGIVGHANAYYVASLTTGGNPTVTSTLLNATAINFGLEYQSGGTSPLVGAVVVPGVYYGPASFGLASVGVGLANFGYVTLSAPFTITWTAANGNIWEFSALTGSYTRNGAALSNTLSIYLDGQLVDENNAALDQSALFVDSFSQQNSGGTIAESGVLSTPDPNSLPEPVSMGIVGLGLAGLAAVRRRRAKI
jgi:MYXO-CTERM domain-containing protein